MHKISADYILPVSSAPLKNGVIVIDDDGIIISLSDRNNFENAELQIYRGIICPGFINAHCHLELSYLKEQITEHTGLVNFIIEFLSKRDDSGENVQQAIKDAEDEMIQNGIVGVGDISNAVTSFLQKSKRRIEYHTFVECLGLLPEKADEFLDRSIAVFHSAKQLSLEASITPHAPYSMSLELMKKIFRLPENQTSIFSYHNQETAEENDLYTKGTGGFLDFYRKFNFQFIADRIAASSVQAHLNIFPEEKRILLVHNTFSSKEDIEFVMNKHKNCYWCLCPNANLFIENTLPDFQNFITYNERICLGTDSYASNKGLSIFEEMKTIQQVNPGILTPQLVSWATLNGAEFFGWNNLGRLEPGKKPGVNLITNVNAETLQLNKNSIVEKLF
ncbi:MAG: amidohydrolase family protein [Chitinophagales bacterium]|nr:amidohydrolase family protein [Chitinophagales bacterium]